MLEGLQALRAELSELRQQQSKQHSHKKHRKHKKKHSSQRKSPRSECPSEQVSCRTTEEVNLAEALTECPPQSSTAISASLPSTLPLFPPSSFIPSPTFVESTIIFTSQIQESLPVFNSIPFFVETTNIFVPTSTSQITESLSVSIPSSPIPFV